MLELHTMTPGWELPTFTPFGLKLIVYFRLTDIAFQIVVEHTPRRAPKGKWPWIVEGDRVLADSGLIVAAFEARATRCLDAHLDAAQRAKSHALRRMVEESLCFSILYFRWTDDAAYRRATGVALSGIAQPLRAIIRPLIRRRILRDLRGQGVLCHSPQEVLGLGSSDIDVLAQQLADSPFMLGDSPSTLDATVTGFLAVLLGVPLSNPLERYARQHPNLVDYFQRMQRQYL